MTVVLSVLKVIGMILLVLLLVFFLLLCLVLFAPISYWVKGDFHEDYEVKGKISFLFPLLSLWFSYKDKKFAYNISLFGFSLAWKKKKKKETLHIEREDALEKPEGNLEENLVGNEENELEANYSDDYAYIDKEEASSEDSISLDEKSDKLEESKTFVEQDLEKKKNESTKKKSNNLKNFWTTSKRRCKEMGKRWDSVKALFDNAEYLHGFHVLKDAFVHLLKIVMPRRFYMEAEFSAGSPDWTGEILGFLAIFPVGYRNRWRIYPDFETEEAYIRGEAELKGRFRFIQILILGLKVILDSSVRRLIEKLRSI